MPIGSPHVASSPASSIHAQPASFLGRLAGHENAALRLAFWSAVLLIYGAAFTVLRMVAVNWATFDLFSLWFPAAGLRFAFLWWAGARFAPGAAVAELLVSVLSGTVELQPSPFLSLVGVIGPCLVYGLVIHVIRSRLRSWHTSDGFDPLPFAVAAVVGPMVACLSALSWALPQLHPAQLVDAQKLFSTLLVFSLGDMLGILLLAPPLLWVAASIRAQRPMRLLSVPPKRWIELVLVLGFSWSLVWMMERIDYGVVLAPVLLATGWIGLRGGRAAGWVCILVSALIILPLSGAGVDDVQRLHAHMLLACIAAGGYLAGSYADAQAIAAMEIRRRDRLLLHADRLKTLRAMSLGVIHEVSQPLSTIALEANSLVDASASPQANGAEIRDMAERIARKTEDLSDMIRRLRRFGEGGGDERRLVGPQTIINDLLELSGTEARNAGVKLEARRCPDVLVAVNDVEIRQALLNLIRNAIAASPKPGGTIWLACAVAADEVVFTVENRLDKTEAGRPGMGIGLFIARAVARAHGGSIRFDHPAPGRIRCTLRLPIAKDHLR